MSYPPPLLGILLFYILLKILQRSTCTQIVAHPSPPSQPHNQVSNIKTKQENQHHTKVSPPSPPPISIIQPTLLQINNHLERENEMIKGVIGSNEVQGASYANPVGACAPCLREHLFALAAYQNKASSPCTPPPDPSNPASDYFPRSISPYISRHRRSDASSAGHRRRHHPPSILFFSTPQVGPSAALDEGSITFDRKKSGKFKLISALFRSHHTRSMKNSEKSSEMDSSTRSKTGSWISALVHKTRRSKVTEVESLPRKNWWDPDQERGLSPDRNYDSLESGSCVSDSPWRPTPSPMRRGMGHRKRQGASGFAVCLSPLVRPSPAHRRSQGSETGFSGDLKSPAHHRHAAAGGAAMGPTLCHNRSRKIADIGRHR